MPVITRSHQMRIGSNAHFDDRSIVVKSEKLDQHQVTNTEAKCKRKLSASSRGSPGWNGDNQPPDIEGLFAKFNERFFWGRLNGVEVRWSSRMTSCAGVCVHKRSMNYCSIRLSAPLLKLRPHSDVVDTLLHEMIHAFLCVSDQYGDENSHGPKFHSHKDRINKAAGTNITVYHYFFEEVMLYKKHWWRCNGPCKNEAPYFGMVKRSMNRVPGPYDRWWAYHKFSCGGTFIKIREPVEYTRKHAKNAEGITSGVLSTSTNLSSGLGTTPMYGLEKCIGLIDLTSIGMTSISTSIAIRNVEKHGGLPVTAIDLSNEPVQKKKKIDNNFEISNCPVCNKKLLKEIVQEHLENCEALQSLFDDYDFNNNNVDSIQNTDIPSQFCPLCAKHIKSNLQAHIDYCLNNGINNIFDEPIIPLQDCYAFPTESNFKTLNVEKTVESSGANNNVIKSFCSICGIHIVGDMESHIDECLSNSDIFNNFDEILAKYNDSESSLTS